MPRNEVESSFVHPSPQSAGVQYQLPPFATLHAPVDAPAADPALQVADAVHQPQPLLGTHVEQDVKLAQPANAGQVTAL